MKKRYFFIVGVIIVSLIILILYPKNRDYVFIDSEKIFIEIVDTNQERQKGLMYREELCDDCGMLFVFEREDFHSFWMKNTYIPLDIVFINSGLEIVEILHAVPCIEDICESYIPKEKALYVLEVNYRKFNEDAIGKKVKMKL